MSRRRRHLLLALAAPLAAASTMAAIALAGGSDPAITLSQSGGGVLFGNTQTVTLTATNPSSQSDWGYNLSYEATLPAHTTYLTTTSADAPTPTVLHNVPAANETTVIWQNVADLSPGSSNSISFTVSHSTTAFAPGDQYTITSGAYVNNLANVRQVPQFDQTTGAPSLFTGSATTSQTSTISAIELQTSEPSPEGKLLRGVHDHRTIYTLTVTNNAVNPTDAITVTEYLPADLEFLGCGTDDNTTDAPTDPGTTIEYPGAPALNADGAPGGLTNCVTPTSVSTVSTTPPGASSPAVYTAVTFPVGTLAASASTQLQFVAGVPLEANTTTWNNISETAPGGLAQESNLDNNNGPLTYHGEDATVYGQAAGTYNDTTAVTSDSALSRTIMNIRILKGADSGDLVQGQDTTWTLTIETGEYRYFTPVTVTDTVPNGLCPIAYTNPTTSDPECQASGSSDDPSLDWDNTPSESNDGTWTLHWTLPDTLGPDSTYVITYHTRTRTHYRSDQANTTPISSNDSVTNSVALASTSYAKCIDGDDECTIPDDTLIPDDANADSNSDSDSATQTAAAPTISKTIQTTAADLPDCTTGTYGSTAPTGLVPGDKVCYELRVVFPAGVNTQSPTVTDFLPPNLTYIPGSAARMVSDDTVDAAAPSVNGNTITWSLGSTVAPGAIFDVVLAGTVAGNLTTYPAGYLTGNLMKTNFSNTPGATFPNRAEQDFTLTAPSIDLYKGVAAYTPPGGGTVTESGPNVDDVTVPGDSAVQWRVDVENQGGEDADAEIWDYLPGGLTCADVSDISSSGTCVNATTDYIDWTGIDLPADSTIATDNQTTLTYTTAIGTGFSPGQLIASSAGVRTFTTTDNQGNTDTYYPQSNIDPSVTSGEENAPAASDPSSVQLTSLGFTHTDTTSVNETGNNATSQATIGEDITYTDTLTVPNGTTLYGEPTIYSTLPASLSTATSVAATYDGSSTLPGAWHTTGDGTANPMLTFSNGAWTNSTGSTETFVLTYTANVLQVAGNVKGDVISDSAALVYWDQSGLEQTDTPAAANVTIVEPSITTSLTNNSSGGIVVPGSTYTYTATFKDSSGTDISPAHDNTLVVTVPAGLTPWSAASGGTAVADGGSDNGWTWSQSLSTLTYDPADVNAGISATVPTFFLNVNSPAISGTTFPTTVVADTTSYPGSPPNGTERTATTTPHAGYTATQTSTTTLAAPALTKSVSPSTATFGSTVLYTVTVALAANVTYYDTTLLDTMPTGVTYDGNATITGCVGCTGSSDTPTLGTTNTSTSGSPAVTTVAFYLSVPTASPSTSIPTSTSARTLTLTFDGHVNSSATDGTGHTSNSINVYDDTTSKDGSSWPSSPPATSGFDQHGTAATAAVTVVEPTPTITKTVSGNDATGHVGPGDSPTYTLTVKDTGASWPLYNVVVSDTPSAVYTNIAAGTGAADITSPWTTQGSTITWTIPEIPASGTVTLTYTATLPPSTSLHAAEAIDNSAYVTASYPFDSAGDGMYTGYTEKDYTAGPSSQDLTWDPPVVTVAQAPASGSTATIDAPFSWQVTLTNTSAGATADVVNVTDTVPADWSYVAGSAKVGGVTVADPSQSGQTLTWTDLVASLGHGASAVLTFEETPTIQAALTYGIGPSNPYQVSASDTWQDSTGATADADGSYASGPATADAYLNPSADLGVSKTLESSPALTEGNTVTYQIVFTNNTSTTGAYALDAVGSDTLPGLLDPSGVTLAPATAWSSATSYSTGNEVSYNGTNWTATQPSSDQQPAAGSYWSSEASVCSLSSQTVTCTWPFLGPGAVRTVDVSALVEPVMSGSISNTATISTTSTDPVSSNNTSTTTNPIQYPTLTITKTYSGTSINSTTGQPGDTITYDLAITNSGSGTAYDATVTDQPNSALDGVTDTTGVGDATTQWSTPGSTMAWTIPTINAGQTIHLDYTATLTSNVDNSQSISNTANVTGYWDTPLATRQANSGFDYDEYENVTPSTATLTAEVPDVTIAQTPNGGSSTATIDSPFTWKVTLTNMSPGAIADTVNVTDTLPVDWNYVAGSAKVGGVTVANPTQSGQTLTWTDLEASIAGSGQKVLTFEATPTIQAALTTGIGASHPHSVSASDTWQDKASSPSDATGAYAAGPANSSAYLYPSADLGVSKTLESSPVLTEGNTVTYQIVFTNNTSTTGAYALDAVGADTLPTSLDPAGVSIAAATAWSSATNYSTGNEVSYGGTNWTATQPSSDQTPNGSSAYWSSEASVCGLSSQTVTCTWPFLGPGAVRTVDVQAVVQPVMSGSISNTATISTTSTDPNSSNNSSTTTNPVQYPTLTITKTYTGTSVNSTAGQPGDTITYDLAIHNSGTAAAYDAAVTDQPNSALDDVTDTTGIGDATTQWSTPGSTMAWTIPTINAGQTIHLDYTAVLTSSVHNGQSIANTAHVTGYWDTPLATRQANSGFDYDEYENVTPSTATLTAEVPDVTITDNTGAGGYPNSAEAQILQPFSWHLVFTNTAAAGAHSVVVKDTLPADYSYTTGSAKLNGSTIADPSISGRILTFTVTALAGSASDTLDFTSVPATTAIDDSQPQQNEAYATWKDSAGATASADGTYQTVDEPAYGNLMVPDLTVTKTVASPTVDAGASTDYTITVANTGDAPARQVDVDDTLPSGESYTPGSATAAPSTGFSETSGTAPDLSWQVAELDAGDSVVITLPVTLDGTLNAGLVLDNTVSVTSNELPTPVTASVNLTTTRDVDVSLVKTGPPGDAAGDEVTWTLDAHNAGPSDARSVEITDPLPAGTVFKSADSGCTNTSGTVTCTIGTLDAGSDATYHITATINSGVTGTITNTATVSSTDHDTNLSNNVSSQTVNIGNSVDLAIINTAAVPVIGQTLDDTFTLVITNAGPSDAYTPTVLDTLPTGLSYVSATPSQGTCSDSGQTVSCALGTVPVGTVPTIKIVVRGDDTGSYNDTATVSVLPQTDINLANNTSTAPMSVVLASDLAVTKTGPANVMPGTDATYVMTATNNGPSADTGVTVTDQLPADAAFVSSSTGCTAGGATVTCPIGALAVGASNQQSVTVLIPATLYGQSLTDTASVTGALPDLDPANNSASFTTVVGSLGQLMVTKVVNHRHAHAGEVVRYTIVVGANDAPVVDVTLCDRLAPHMVYVAAPGAQFHSGSACWTVPDLGMGSRMTVHVLARLDLGATGTLVAPVTASAPAVKPAKAHANVVTSPKTPTAGGGVTG
jgi:uncharacterized repeat protein (TIGR01451 family)/fimbrial isopeptide formation D2 family protein